MGEIAMAFDPSVQRRVARGTWVRFVELPPKPKTEYWRVDTADGLAALGVIKWHGPWRTYAFFPASDTVFEPTCLAEIAQFIKDLMAERKR